MQNNENNGIKICPRCKKEINSYDDTCIHCGEKFEIEYPDERAAYIQKNVGTYLNKFSDINKGKPTSSWNWCGFLFSFHWMLYRKMYGLGVIVFVIYCLVSVVVETSLYLFGINEILLAVITLIIDIAYAVVIGLLGDHWYQKKINKLVAEGENMSPEEKQKHHKKGGVNLPLVLVLVVISVVLNLLTL